MATAVRARPASGRDPLTWLVGFFGFLVAALGSWVPSIWTDEAATISGATRSWAELDALTRNIDAVHLGYYALMKPWFELVGVNAVTLRLPSAIFAGLTGVLVVLLARHWLGRAAALGAGTLAVLLPRATHIGIEGRSWALVTLLVVAASLALVAWRSSGRNGWLVAYALAMGAGIVLEIYLVFVLVAHGISLLLVRTRPTGLAKVLLAGLGAVGIGAPIIFRALGQTGQIAGAPFDPFAWARQLLINQAFAGEPLGPVGWLDALWRPAAAGLALVCWALVGLLGWFWWRRRDRVAGVVLAWCLPLALVPGTLVAAWSVAAGANMYNPRYFSFSHVAMAICVAAALARLPRARAWLAVGLIAVLLVPGYLGQRTINAKSGADWSQVAALIEGSAQPGDGVFFATQPSTRPISIAYPAPFDALTDIGLDQTPAAAATLSGTDHPLSEVVDSAPNRVWAIWRSDDGQMAADRAVFAATGYQEVALWQGSRDTVIEFVRS